MGSTISMQEMRYLNLFGKVTKINTRFFFRYNETFIFCVPKGLVRRAVGENGKNVKKLSEIFKKRIKIIARPRGIEDAKEFISQIISPVQFKEIKINSNEIIVSASRQSKAALIGRNKRRLKEMQAIVRDFFKKDFKVI